MELESYVTGFVDGEGSFLVSFSRRGKMSVGSEVRPSFTVSQHKRSKEVLEKLLNYFRCGSLRFNKRDSTWKYEVRSLDDLLTKVIPHFERFPLQTSKRLDFIRFKDICLSMERREHLTSEGIRKIIDSAYEMNNLGARRYDKIQVLRGVVR